MVTNFDFPDKLFLAVCVEQIKHPSYGAVSCMQLAMKWMDEFENALPKCVRQRLDKDLRDGKISQGWYEASLAGLDTPGKAESRNPPQMNTTSQEELSK